MNQNKEWAFRYAYMTDVEGCEQDNNKSGSRFCLSIPIPKYQYDYPIILPCEGLVNGKNKIKPQFEVEVLRELGCKKDSKVQTNQIRYLRRKHLWKPYRILKDETKKEEIVRKLYQSLTYGKSNLQSPIVKIRTELGEGQWCQLSDWEVQGGAYRARFLEYDYFRKKHFFMIRTFDLKRLNCFNQKITVLKEIESTSIVNMLISQLL
jgi:hypothetical protein